MDNVELEYMYTDRDQSPVVQSIVSLTSSLVVKMLTVLVSTDIFAEKNVSSFCKCKSYSHFFSKNISVYAIFNAQSLKDMLTNDIVSFEHLGQVCLDAQTDLGLPSSIMT